MSRILSNPTDVKPVCWRPAISVAKPLRPAPPNVIEPASMIAPEEASRFRARIAELEVELEKQARQSWDSGFRAGEDAAAQKLTNESHLAAENVARTIAEMAVTRGAMIRRAEADTVRLSIEIARRVLHRELSVDEFALQSLIRAALQKLQTHEIFRVRVHPDQEKVMRACLEQMERSKGIEISSDPVLPKGGIVFEISSGSLDASVETQLREIERGLADHIELRA